MQDRKTIETSIIQKIISLTSKITFFGLGGVMRAIITAFSAALEELFYDITRTQRKLFSATAEGDDLHELAKDYNMTGLGAAAAGVVLAFKGTSTHVITAGTQVKSTSGIIFETVQALTLGSANSPYDLYPCEPLTDKVEAIATTTGASGSVQANTVTTLVVADSDVTSVTNPSHAQGGVDAEKDDQFRTRIAERILLKNQGTLKKYEVLAKEINEEVFRVYACKGEGTSEVAIYVMNRSGTGMSAADRSELENSIKNYAPVCSVPRVYNIEFTDVDVYAKISLKTGYTLQDVFEKILVNLADFVNWAEAEFGAEIDDADILSIVNNSEGVKDIDLATFQPVANIECAKNSIPRVGTVYLVNMNNAADTINYTAVTSYIYS